MKTLFARGVNVGNANLFSLTALDFWYTTEDIFIYYDFFPFGSQISQVMIHNSASGSPRFESGVMMHLDFSIGWACSSLPQIYLF